MTKKFNRSATLREDGTVLICADKFTSKVVPYSESLHECWPDLERPKKKRRKRVKKDDAERNVESCADGIGVRAEE